MDLKGNLNFNRVGTSLKSDVSSIINLTLDLLLFVDRYGSRIFFP